MKALLIAAPALLLLSGCAVSLQPFYTTVAIFDDRSMEGRWKDDSSLWQVTRTGPGRFDIASCNADESDCKPETTGVLFRIAGVTFLDFQEKTESRFSSSILPHGLFQIEPNSGGGLDLRLLDPDLITQLARRAYLDADFADLESGVLLTSKPEDLQSFLVRHLGDPQVFGELHHFVHP